MRTSLRRSLAATFFVTTSLSSGTALAQGGRGAATAVDELVVTAAATQVNIVDAPASVSVVTREEIERQPYQNLGQLLGRLPGVTGGVSPTGALSKITIRGLPDNYTLILVDGRRIGNSRDISYRPDLGRQDLNWISPDMIERIEVVRGPMSSIYGSDAMGGVINIITRKVAPTWRGSINGSYTWQEQGVRGDAYQLGGNLSGPLHETLGLRLGGTYARTNPDELVISGNEGTAGVVNKAVNGVLTWTPSSAHTLSLEGSYGLEDPIAPDTPLANGSAQSSWGSNIERTTLRVGHQGDWRFGQSRLDIYRNAFVNEDQAAGGGTAEFEELIADGLFNFSAQLIWDHKIAVGGQYRREELTNTQTIGTIPVDYDGNVVQGATLKGKTAALFAEDQITLHENLFLTVGGRLDSHSRYGEHISPRIYLVWHPAQYWTIRGGVSQGFRAPSLKENSAGAATFSRGGGCGTLTGMADDRGRPYSGGCYMAGNPDLKPEESTNYEIGGAFDRDGWRLAATYFHTDFDNKIEYAPLGYFQGRWWTKMANVQKARTRGVELTGSARLTPSLTARANATWMIQAKNLDTGANLITSPEWSGFGSLDWRASARLNLVLSAQYTGKQLGGGSTITDGYTMFDLTGAFDATDKITLRAGIQNLLEKEITGSNGFGYYSPGRRFFVGLSSRF